MRTGLVLPLVLTQIWRLCRLLRLLRRRRRRPKPEDHPRPLPGVRLEVALPLGLVLALALGLPRRVMAILGRLLRGRRQHSMDLTRSRRSRRSRRLSTQESQLRRLKPGLAVLMVTDC